MVTSPHPEGPDAQRAGRTLPPAGVDTYRTRQAQGVQAISRVGDVLRLFSHTHPELSLAEIASGAGLPRSTTHRLLAALAGAELVRRGSVQGRYRLGAEAARLGQVAQSALRPGAAVYQRLRALSERFGETVGLTALVEHDVLVIDRVESTLILRMAYGVGTRLTAYNTASGRVLLGTRPDAEVDAYLAAVTNADGAPMDDVIRDQTRAAIRNARALGYALDHQEYAAGLSCLAVPIVPPDEVPAALAISGPTPRVRPLFTRGTVDALREAAAELAALPELTSTLARLAAPGA